MGKQIFLPSTSGCVLLICVELSMELFGKFVGKKLLEKSRSD